MRLVPKIVTLAAGLLLALIGTASVAAPPAPSPGPDQPSREVQASLVASRIPSNVYYPLAAPCRVLDTRGAGAGALNNGSVRSYPVAGLCGIPTYAVSVQASISSANPRGSGFLRAWASGLPEPAATVLQYTAHQGTTTGAVLALGGGQTRVHNFGGPTDLVIDVFGYYAVADAALIDILGSKYYGAASIVTSSQTATGEYAVSYDHSVVGCAVQVTPWSLGTAYYATVDYLGGGLLGGDVRIHIKNSAGAAANAPFIITAVC